jgi:uncharacterized protein with HEPN domain
LLQDGVLQAALLHHFTVMGEAAGRSQETRERHPEIPWAEIVSQRNFGLDWSLLWKTLDEDVPMLERQIEGILKVEFGEESGQGE